MGILLSIPSTNGAAVWAPVQVLFPDAPTAEIPQNCMHVMNIKTGQRCGHSIIETERTAASAIMDRMAAIPPEKLIGPTTHKLICDLANLLLCKATHGPGGSCPRVELAEACILGGIADFCARRGKQRIQDLSTKRARASARKVCAPITPDTTVRQWGEWLLMLVGACVAGYMNRDILVELAIRVSKQLGLLDYWVF